MKTLPFCLLSLLLLLSPTYAAAQVYQTVDANGTVGFSDSPPPAGVETTVVDVPPLNVAATSGSLREPATAPAATTKQATPQPAEVDIYVTSWCRYCQRAKAWLTQQGISYRAYDIEKDKIAAKRMRQLGGTGGVPFAVINGQKILGFSTKAYAEALGLP